MGGTKAHGAMWEQPFNRNMDHAVPAKAPGYGRDIFKQDWKHGREKLQMLCMRIPEREFYNDAVGKG